MHTERLYPCGETQILFHYGTPFLTLENNNRSRQPQSIICGQMTKYQDIIADSAAGLIGIVFHPYSLYTISHIPSDELSDASLSLTDINRIFKPLENRIRDARSTKERISIIEEFLNKRVLISNLVHFNIMKESSSLLSHSNSGIRIKQLAEHFSMSERQYERIFKDFVGVPPKTFSELMRFKKSFYVIKSTSNGAYAANASGYYDQPQFVKSFKKYSGYTPGEFLKII